MNNLIVNGETNLKGNAHLHQDLQVDGTTNLNGNANIDGNTLINRDLTVNGNSNLKQNVNIDGNLTVNGESNFNGAVSFNNSTMPTEFNSDVKLNQSVKIAMIKNKDEPCDKSKDTFATDADNNVLTCSKDNKWKGGGGGAICGGGFSNIMPAYLSSNTAFGTPGSSIGFFGCAKEYTGHISSAPPDAITLSPGNLGAPVMQCEDSEPFIVNAISEKTGETGRRPFLPTVVFCIKS